MVGLSGILDIGSVKGKRSVDNKRQIARWKRIVTRFKGKLVKMMKDVNGTFDDYSI